MTLGNKEIVKLIVENLCASTGTKKKYWANKCGYSDKEFSRLLNGHKLIGCTEIKKLCHGLGVLPNDIIKLDIMSTA